MRGLSIILDIDGCLCDFIEGFEKEFNISFDNLSSDEISNKVESLKKNFTFWTSLNKLTTLDFTPSAYCTARINSKHSTKTWLSKNGFPNSPVYQVKGYNLSKVPQLKRTPIKDNDVRILIDDTWKNVEDAVNNGIPAFLLDTPYNRDIKTHLRIKDLKFKTICNAYRRFYF